jgi:hypothetical protein
LSATIYQQLLEHSKGLIEIHETDLTIHDQNRIKTFEPGSKWLWVCYQCGTYLTKWESDFAGELLYFISHKNGCPGCKVFIIECNEELNGNIIERQAAELYHQKKYKTSKI